MSFCSKKVSNRGFTLIELITVIAIFTIMTGIMLANLPQFRDQTSLELLAQQAAINTRVAQVYSVGTRISHQIAPQSDAQRFNWYGIHFDTSADKQNQYFMFADVNKNGAFDDLGNNPCQPNHVPSEGDDTCEALHTLLGGYRISSFCFVGTGDDTCTQISPDTVDIVYRRPDPEATFCIDGQDCQLNPNTAVELRLTLERANNPTRQKRVIVSKNGQIAVEPGFVVLEP